MNEKYEYGFIVDTNLHTWDFKTKMFAFITGNTDEHGNGWEESKLYDYNDFEIFNNILLKNDVNRDFTAVHTYATPNIYDNGRCFIYNDDTKDEALEHYIKNEKHFYEKFLNGLKNRRILPKNWNQDMLNKMIEIIQQKLEKINTIKEPPKIPVHNSIIIYMKTKPSEEDINFLKERAYEFCNYYNQQNNLNNEYKLQIISFRFNKIVTTEIIENI